MRNTERITLYLSKELNKEIDGLVKKSLIGEKKNTILLKCLLSGLKTQYGIDFEKLSK